jgi:hypothetical protein
MSIGNGFTQRELDAMVREKAQRSDADEVLSPRPSTLDRSQCYRALADFCRTAPIGEVQLLHELMTRLLRGREQYGAWVAANENRDLEREQYEELLDAQVYGAMMRVRADR